MTGMSGSTGRTLLAVPLHHLRLSCYTQSAMRGARSTTWCTVVWTSKMLWHPSRGASFSGRGRSMRGSTKPPNSPNSKARAEPNIVQDRCNHRGSPSGPSPTQGKGKGATPPAHWAFRSPKNILYYCRDHHLYKNCNGQCGRSHNCPVRVGGWICDAPLAFTRPRSVLMSPNDRRFQQVPLALTD